MTGLLTLAAGGSDLIVARGDSAASCGRSELVAGTEADGGLEARSMVDCEPFVAVILVTCTCFAGVTKFVGCGVP